MKTDNLNNIAVLVMESPRYSVMPRSESAVAKNLRRRDPDLVINYFNIDDYQRRQPAVNGKVRQIRRRGCNMRRPEPGCLTEIGFVSKNCLQALLYDIEQT